MLTDSYGFCRFWYYDYFLFQILSKNTGLSVGGKHSSNQQLTAIAETLMITLVLM